jgi:hypothetical protein
VKTRLRAFAKFWYDFVVGDDWSVAVGVVLMLALTYVVSRTDIPAWWIVPTALVIYLPLSLWRRTRR